MSQFSEPQRLAPIALIRVFSKILKSILQQFWPLALAYFFQVSKQEETRGDEVVLIAIYAVLFLTVANGIIRYLTYRWSVDDDALVIRHGVIRKVNLRIPFERIQAIDLQQPWYFRIAGATRFVVDTAGSKSKEAEIWALDYEVAETLRAFIHTKQDEAGEQEGVGAANREETETPWIEVDTSTLAKIGLFRNHFRTIAGFFGGAFYLYSQMQEVLSSDEINEELEHVYNVIPKVFGVFLFLGIIVVFAAVAFSVIFTIIRFYNFKLVERGDAFIAKYGLINSKARQVKPAKIQIMRTEHGPVFRWLGIVKFKIEQAYAEKKNKEDFTIPGSPVEQVARFRQRVFGKIGEHVHPGTSFNWFWYRSVRLGLLPMLIPAIIFYITQETNYLYFFLWIPFQLVYSYLLWANQGVFIDDEKLSVRREVIFDKRAVLRLERVQSIILTESMYQRRKGLATLVVETAGGSVQIPFIPKATATALANYLLYKSESDIAEWM